MTHALWLLLLLLLLQKHQSIGLQQQPGMRLLMLLLKLLQGVCHQRRLRRVQQLLLLLVELLLLLLLQDDWGQRAVLVAYGSLVIGHWPLVMLLLLQLLVMLQGPVQIRGGVGQAAAGSSSSSWVGHVRAGRLQ